MGTTFVTIEDGSAGDKRGFWMNDGMLELWLRLLSLHLPEPDDLGNNQGTPEIRNRWLLASRGYFGGHVPHEMELVHAKPEYQAIVRVAIVSLMDALNQSDAPLDADTLNLLGVEGGYGSAIDRARLRDIGYAFVDLLEGRIKATVRSTDIMPGSIPYTRASTR